MKISDKIKESRIKSGLTRQQLADLCGLREQSVYKIETGRRYPKFDTMIKIAKVLNVSLDIFA